MNDFLTMEMIDAFIAKYPVPQPENEDAPGGKRRRKVDDVRTYLEDHNIAVKQEKIGAEGQIIFVLETCVWDPSHTDGSAYVIQYKGPGRHAGCHHASCQGKKWSDFRDVVEADEVDDETHKQDSAAKRLISYIEASLAEPGSELFHDEGSIAFATVPVEGENVRPHPETHRIRSRSMRLWVGWVFYTAEGIHPARADVDRALDGLEAKALYDGPVRDVYLRYAQHSEHEGIWIDLGTEDRAAVHLTRAGWKIAPEPPVKFVRKQGMLPLPIPKSPASGETLQSLLRPYINVAAPKMNEVTRETEDYAWVLYVTWLCSTFKPTGPFAILQLHGEPGSAKSTVSDVTQSLVDPNEANRNGEPAGLRDLAIAARNSWLLPYDNLRFMPPWLSDALCRMSTGGGFRTRSLYTDDDEAIFSYKRPVLLTGVSEVAVKPDLLDRTISLNLERIGDDRRRTETAFWADFEADKPLIFGALLDLVSGVLRRLPDVKQENLPRMADFSVWAQAVELAIGWPEGTFKAAYGIMRQEARDVALENSAIYAVLMDWLNIRRMPIAGAPGETEWEGNMTALLKELNRQRQFPTGLTEGTSAKAPRGWPTSPKGLGGMVTELITHLRQVGIEVTYRPFGRWYRIIDKRSDEQYQKSK